MPIGTRYITENRKPLETLLPLKSPMVLFIDPSDACCFKCQYCPTSDKTLMKEVNRPLKMMDFSLYKKIIDDLHKFETKIKVLRLYSHGEPLLNKHFAEMVRYAKDSNKIESVDTTTNGVLLNPELNLKIIESGIDRINISVNGVNAKQYKSFTGVDVDVDFEKYVSNIKHLYENKKQCYIFIKINGDTISKEDEQEFLRIFEPIADTVGIERSQNCWQDFESKGFIKKDDTIGIYGQKIEKEALVCPYSLYQIAIHSDGKVSACFLGWNRKLILGDMATESLYDVWHGKKVKDFQKYMLTGERKSHFYCKNCAQLKGGNPSNIDEYAEELFLKY